MYFDPYFFKLNYYYYYYYFKPFSIVFLRFNEEKKVTLSESQLAEGSWLFTSVTEELNSGLAIRAGIELAASR